MTTEAPTFHGVSLHITVTIAPENVPTFLEHLQPLIKLVGAEPECTFSEFYTSAFEPGVITCVECWNKDLQWLGEVCSLAFSANVKADLVTGATKERLLQAVFRNYGADVS